MGRVVVFILCGLVFDLCYGWYLPGSAPNEYEPGASVPITADKLTSARTQLPYGFHHLPYCRPAVVEDQAENLGESLTGDLIQTTAFDVRMLLNKSCELLCAKKISKEELAMFMKAMDDEYMVNFLADNLPGAMPLYANTSQPDATAEKQPAEYSVPIPVGVARYPEQHVLVNHWNFVISYHPGESKGLRVVGFEVTPESIYHQIVKDEPGKITYQCAGNEPLILERLQFDDQGTTTIPFTYSVKFRSSDRKWATRWDIYLQDASRQSDIHWFSIVNALMIVLLLSGIVALILLRTLLRDIARYNQLDDIEDAQEEFGWKLIHGDIFRRPNHSKLLAACAGTGVQLLGMTFVLLLISTLGFLSPAHRGSFLQAGLFLFTLMGFPAGYVSARFNKLFEGDNITRNFTVTCMTALQFPGVCFGTFFILNTVLWSKGSSGAVHFGTMFLLLFLWFGISMPLVFLGSYYGYKQPAISVPVRTNQIPRQIPPSHWIFRPIISHAVTGILPFCAIFTELLFILGSVWQHRFYYLFGFVTLVLVILIITCAEVAISFVYFLCCAENYAWWWRAYWSSAASAVYVFLYSVFYFYARLNITQPASTILYFGYTCLMSYAFFLLTGAVGFISAFFFVRAIYGAVKID